MFHDAFDFDVICFVWACFHLKADIDMVGPFIVQNQKFPLFPHLLATWGIEGHYIWYQSKVKTLGPDGLIDMQVCCEMCDLTMCYYNAWYRRNIAELHAWVFEN